MTGRGETKTLQDLQVNMEIQREHDDVLLLLEKYCNLRSPRLVLKLKGAGDNSALLSWRTLQKSFNFEEDSIGSASKDQVPERLAKIADSAPIAEQNLQTQDEIIQRLVQLMTAFGDDINEKLKQNPALKQQLKDLNYNLFEKLTSTVQNLVAPPGRPACSDGPVQQQQKIAWAFEVTSRLSAVSVVHRRTVLQFGARYIKENHAVWVKQHGGWEEAFD